MVGRPRRENAHLAEDDGRSAGASVQALDRGLALLQIIAEADGLSLTSIAQRAGIAPSTAHRILATLKASGFVECDDARGGYLIGVKAFKIGTAFLRNRKLVDVGRRTLRKLMQTSGETANIAIENDGAVVYLAQFECHNAIRAFHRPGARAPLHATALGKAMLSTMADKDVLKLLHRIGLPRFTPNTIDDAKLLLEDLAAIRRRGWAIDAEEREIGMCCIGAPIFNEHGEAIGAISASGPTVRFTPERLGELGPMVKRAAAEITDRVGGVPPAGEPAALASA